MYEYFARSGDFLVVYMKAKNDFGLPVHVTWARAAIVRKIIHRVGVWPWIVVQRLIFRLFGPCAHGVGTSANAVHLGLCGRTISYELVVDD